MSEAESKFEDRLHEAKAAAQKGASDKLQKVAEYL